MHHNAADRIAALGLVATTNHGGAGKFWQPLIPYFAGRHVIIVPDNDAPGERHAKIVGDALTGTAIYAWTARYANTGEIRAAINANNKSALSGFTSALAMGSQFS